MSSYLPVGERELIRWTKFAPNCRQCDLLLSAQLGSTQLISIQPSNWLSGVPISMAGSEISFGSY